MIKFIGLAGMALAIVCTGYTAASNVKSRVEELLYVRRLMLMFQGELRYKNAMLSDAFNTVAMRAKGIYKEFFTKLSVATEENYTMPMSKVFSDNVEKILKGHTMLSREDLSMLKELGETLGYQDQKMQLANIDLYIDRVSQSIDESRKKMVETMKMYRTLGVMGALMSIIVFV